MAVVTSGMQTVLTDEQAFDEVLSPGRKWFSLQQNALDGTYHPMPSDASGEQVGWWGSDLSDVDGAFSRPQRLEARASMAFDGVDDYIDLGNPAALQITGDQTIELILKPSSFSARCNPYNKAYGGEGTITQETDGTLNYYYGTAGGDATPYQSFNSGQALVLNQVNKVALVRDLTNMKLRWYVNGRVVETDASYSSAATSTLNALIGNGYTSPYAGEILEVRVWSKAVAANDLFAPLVGNEANLAGWWRLDEVSGSIAYDSGPNGINGTIYGSPVRNPLNRSVQRLRIVGDATLGEYPVDFTIKLYNGSTLLHTETVTGNDSTTWSKQLPQVLDPTRIVVDVTKVNKASRSVKLVDATNQFSFSRADMLAVTAAETHQAGVLTTSNDSLIISGVESREIRVSFTKTDTLTIVPTDTGFFRLYEFKRADTLTASGVDTSAPVTNVFSKSDSLVVVTDEQKAITALIYKGDILRLDPTVEVDDITVDFSSVDTLTLIGVEDPTLTNIHSAMNADTRQVFARVEITYTDPFNDETVQYTASETGRLTSPEQLSDNITSPKYKWFSLHDNKLDGSYHPLPEANEYSVGWWGTHLSDADGMLPVAPTITVTFASRALTSLKVIGDDKLNVFPVDFTISAYDASDTVVHTETVTGNTQLNWSKNITPVLGVVKVGITINKINKANSVVKLTEFFTAVKETYESDLLYSVDLLEEVGYNTGGVPIGNISANEVDISISNFDRRFDLNNRQSSLYGYVKRNRRVQVWMGAYVGPNIEWHPMGTFWTTSWDISKDSMVATLTARDRLELLRLTDFTKSIVYQNYTLYQLFELILLDAGLFHDEFILDTELQNIIVPYAWFDRMTHREAIQHLAGCAIVQVFTTKEGKVKVNLNLDATPTHITTFDEDVNVYSAKYPLAVSEQINYVEVTAKQWTVGTTENLYESSESISLDAGASVTKTYEFSTKPAISVNSPTITADAGIVVDSYTAYAWGAEVTFRNDAPTTGTITQVIISGQPLKDTGKQVAIAKDDALIRDDGKIKVTVEHDFIQGLNYAQSLATTILDTFKTARYDVTLHNRGDVALRLGDRVLVDDPQQDIKVPYVITRQNINWAGYLSATTEGTKL